MRTLANPFTIAFAAVLVSITSTPRAQALWNQRAPAAVPPAANSAAMIWDRTRGVAVLFGGSFGAGASDQTWEYDGLTWTQVATPTKPPGRYGPAMAFDVARSVTVMFGGYVGSGSGSSDTWEYDGVTWKQITTTNTPSARAGAHMEYDVRAQRIVMHGGSGGAGYFNETWEYDGITSTWSQLTNAGAIDQVLQFAMVYDLVRGKTMVFGGVNASFALQNSLWELDSSSKTWSKVAVSGAVPRTRRLVAGAFDIGRNVMVVHGGDKFPGELSDTWEYDVATQTWTDTTVIGAGPVLAREHVMVYDPGRATVVLWGGITNNMRTNWTGQYGFRGTFRSFANGCAGSPIIGVPALTATSPGPIIGQTMRTRVAPAPNGGFMFIGFSNTRHQSGLPLPISLSPLGAFGCSLYVSTEIVLPVSATAGAIDFQLPVPLNPTLSGLDYFQQAFVQDIGSNPLNHVMSNATQATIL